MSNVETFTADNLNKSDRDEKKMIETGSAITAQAGTSKRSRSAESWILTIVFAGAAMSVLQVICLRFRYAKSAAYSLVVLPLYAPIVCWAHLWPWHVAFPNVLSQDWLRLTMRWASPSLAVAIGVGWLITHPNPLQLTGLRIFAAASFPVYHVILFAYPAWKSRDQWWERRARGTFNCTVCLIVFAFGA